MISFILPGPPVGVNHGYKTVPVRGRAALKLSDEALYYKALLASRARAAHRAAGAPPAIEHGAVVGIRFVFATLGSDLDGPVKFVLDSIASGSPRHPGARLVVNDTRVRQLVLMKGDCDGEPRTEVSIASPGERGCPTCGCLCRRLLP